LFAFFRNQLHTSFGIATTIFIQLGTTKNNANLFVYQITNFFKQSRKKSLSLHGKLLNILVTPKPIQLGEKKEEVASLDKTFCFIVKNTLTNNLVSYSLLQSLPILQANWCFPTHG
jgi:hypothetical protein